MNNLYQTDLVFLAVFNQKSLYNGYKKRTKNIVVDHEEYAKARATDPDFLRDGASLQYGKVWNYQSVLSVCLHVLRQSCDGWNYYYQF